MVENELNKVYRKALESVRFLNEPEFSEDLHLRIYEFELKGGPISIYHQILSNYGSVALFSFGQNDYSHPNSDYIKYLKNKGFKNVYLINNYCKVFSF